MIDGEMVLSCLRQEEATEVTEHTEKMKYRLSEKRGMAQF